MHWALACLLGMVWTLTAGQAQARLRSRLAPTPMGAAAERDTKSAAAKKKNAKKSRGRAPKGKAKETPEPTPAAAVVSPAAPQAAAGTPPPASESSAAAQSATTLPAAPALPTKYRTVALFPVRGIDVGSDLVQGMERSLLNEIDELAGLRSVSPSDVTSDLGQYALDPVACGGEIKCLAQAGRYARAHWALESRIASLGGTLTVSMRLIDTESATELGRVAEPVADNADERAQELHRFAIQLLASPTYVGTLVIQTSVPGSEVYLDDRLVGTTPLAAPLANLRAGPHIMRLAKSGYADIYQFVDVVYNRVSTIKADLESNVVAGVIVEAESTTGFAMLFVAASEAGVEIRIDGEPRGMTPLAAPIEKVAAGKRRVSLRKEGATPIVQEVQFEKGQRTDVSVTRSGGTLRVDQVSIVDAAAPLGVASNSPGVFEPALARLTAGAKIGVLSDLAAEVAPAAVLESAYWLDTGFTDLGLVAEGGYSTSSANARMRVGEEALSVRARTSLWSLSVSVASRFLLGHDWATWGGVGAGAAIVRSEISIRGGEEMTELGTVPSVQAFASVGRRLWRGFVFAELRYGWQRNPRLRGLVGELSSLSASVGFRLGVL